ncbi:hypothetical protein CEE45_07950 [Candidatus Heimdallarchaeota archaeon B3_Heim]|nr:MAG: hypothetical protein CEE45_07950 [Candidatus Heimdallarchaeota archaeon B3_Heim]
MDSPGKLFLEGKKHSRHWREQLNFSQMLNNVFQDDFPISFPQCYINTSEIQRLSHLLGQMVNATPLPNEILSLTLLGPRRIGKSSAARFISQEINSIVGPNYSCYVQYDHKFWEWWEETDFSSTQIFFLDDIFPIWDDLSFTSFQDLLRRSSHDKIVIVTLLNSIEDHWLRRRSKSEELVLFDHKPLFFHYKKPSHTEIVQILKERMDFLESTQFLPMNILRYAGILSLGLPGLALWIIRNIPLKVIDRNKVQKITLDDFQSVVSRLSFEKALRLIIDNNARIVQEEKDESGGEFWPIIDPLKAISPSFTRSLTRIKKNALPKKEILEEMIFLDYFEGSIQRSELQERSGIKDSSLTYQCQTLLKAGIISYFKEGREVYYRLSSPMKETLELLFFE